MTTTKEFKTGERYVSPLLPGVEYIGLTAVYTQVIEITTVGDYACCYRIVTDIFGDIGGLFLKNSEFAHSLILCENKLT